MIVWSNTFDAGTIEAGGAERLAGKELARLGPVGGLPNPRAGLFCMNVAGGSVQFG